MLHPVTPKIWAAALAVALAVPVSAQLGIDLGSQAKPKATRKSKKAAPKAGPKAPLAKPAEGPPAATEAPPPEIKVPARRVEGPAVTMPELNLGERKGDAGKRVAEANRVFASGDYETAALAYDAIVRDPALAEVRDEARYQLAKTLVKMGLYHSALAKLDEILSKGPQGTRYFHNALEWLFFVGQKTVNESAIISEVARHASGSFPPASQDRFNYLLARYSYERGLALEEAGQAGEAKRAYQEARRLSSLVRAEAGAKSVKHEDSDLDQGDVFAKARFLEGLVQYAQGDGQGAVESFKDVVRLTNPRRARSPDPRMRELAFLQLARIHYEHKQNRYAIFYYDRMPWGGESWLEGLWESSYAHYRIGDYEKALGNLLTLQSSYFRDEWFPESWILKAIIYYENCRYPEARGILEEFHNVYGDVLSELDRITARPMQPTAFYELVEDAAKGRTSTERPMTRRVMKLALTDANVKQLTDSIIELENEMDVGLSGRREAFRASPLAADLKAKLQAERKRMAEEAGVRAKAKLEYERDGLKDLLTQALRIKIEVSRKEREVLEGALTHGGRVEELHNYRYTVAVSDEHQYWPYNGEFWRDELGTYTYTLTKGCQDTGARAIR